MWAFNAILTPPYKDSELTIQMGILIGLCSLMMSSPATDDGNTHPSSFKRLNAYIEWINPSPNSQLYVMACLYIGVWDMVFSKGYDWLERWNDYKEMYSHVYKQIVH